MSANADRAALGAAVRSLDGRCRFCQCEGGKCATDEPGEKCFLVAELGGLVRSRCNGAKCQWKWLWEQKANRRRRRRSA